MHAHLWRQDIVTAEELSAKSTDELLALDNIGPKRVAQIAGVLGKHGYSLSASGAEG